MLATARTSAQSPRILPRWLGLAVGLLAFGLGPARVGLANPSPARATYETTGTIDPTGMTGAPRVRFVGASGAADSGAPVALGSFAVAPAGAGSEPTTYDRTPVTVEMWTRAIDGTSTAASDGTPAAPAVIRGWLSGTAGGTGSSALSVLFDQGLQPDDPRFYQPHPLPPFPAGSSFGPGDPTRPPGFLGFNAGRDLLTLDPSGGATPLAGQLDLAVPTPEPTPLLIFLAAGALLGLARRGRRG